MTNPGSLNTVSLLETRLSICFCLCLALRPLCLSKQMPCSLSPPAALTATAPLQHEHHPELLYQAQFRARCVLFQPLQMSVFLRFTAICLQYSAETVSQLQEQQDMHESQACRSVQRRQSATARQSLLACSQLMRIRIRSVHMNILAASRAYLPELFWKFLHSAHLALRPEYLVWSQQWLAAACSSQRRCRAHL